MQLSLPPNPLKYFFIPIQYHGEVYLIYTKMRRFVILGLWLINLTIEIFRDRDNPLQSVLKYISNRLEAAEKN